MDDATTIAAILSALAAGDDPFTGLRLTDARILEDDRVRAALAAAAERLDPDMRLSNVQWVDETAGTSKAPAGASRKGESWTSEEQDRLVQAFDLDLPIADIAREFQRTQGAITSRLVYLGLKPAPDSPKGDERFLRHFERGHLLPRAVTVEVLERAARVLAAVDPEHARARLEAALAQYAAHEDAGSVVRGLDGEGRSS